MTKVLVVDDMVHIRELVQKTLEGQGYRVTTVPGADQALEKIFQEAFDLVILDIDLGRESGITVLKTIREKNTNLPVVIYSGCITPEIENEAKEAGATEILRKDIGIPLVVKQIGRIMRAQEQVGVAEHKDKEKVILVADDQENVRQLLKNFFASKGYKVLEAKNGYEAVQTVRSQRVSTVLLDIEMPVMSGMEALPKLMEVNPRLGVVMATGVDDAENVKAAIEMGAYGYVLKPFDFLYLELVVLSRLAIAAG